MKAKSAEKKLRTKVLKRKDLFFESLFFFTHGVISAFDVVHPSFSPVRRDTRAYCRVNIKNEIKKLKILDKLMKVLIEDKGSAKDKLTWTSRMDGCSDAFRVMNKNLEAKKFNSTEVARAAAFIGVITTQAQLTLLVNGCGEELRASL